jgi:hypothetical protein
VTLSQSSIVVRLPLLQLLSWLRPATAPLPSPTSPHRHPTAPVDSRSRPPQLVHWEINRHWCLSQQSSSRHHRSKSNDRILSTDDDKPTAGPETPRQPSVAPKQASPTKPRRARTLSNVAPQDVETAYKSVKSKSSRQAGGSRSRSEINLDEVKAAFTEQRKTARPHPFLAAKDSKRRTASASSPRQGSPAMTGRVPFSGSPAESPLYGRSPAARRRSEPSSSLQTRHADRKGKAVGAHAKRPHPVLAAPASAGAGVPVRQRKSLPRVPVLGPKHGSPLGSKKQAPATVSLFLLGLLGVSVAGCPPRWH